MNLEPGEVNIRVRDLWQFLEKTRPRYSSAVTDIGLS